MRRDVRLRLARRLSSCLIIVGGLVLAYPLWSAGYASVQQTRLESAYVQEERAFWQLARRKALQQAAAEPTVRMARLAGLFADRVAAGEPIGRLRIPRLGLNRVVVQGRSRGHGSASDPDQALLRSGPVHYANTPLPGQGQPVAVAAHRTTYGAPFLHLDRLRRGDRLTLVTPYGRFVYRVVKRTVTRPSDTTVLRDRGYDLVLTTCHPPYSAARRLVLWAKLKRFAFR